MHQNSLKNFESFVTNYLIDPTAIEPFILNNSSGKGIVVDPNFDPANTPVRSLLIADIGSLDVNGTYRPQIEFWGSGQWGYVGCDIELGPNVDVVLPSGDEEEWFPAFKRMFDVVISGQCLEHVRKPWRWIKQASSILKPGGLIWITAPHTWEYHEYPHDCYRYWPEGFVSLFEEGGLIPLNCYVSDHDTVGIAIKPCDPRNPELFWSQCMKKTPDPIQEAKYNK